MMRMIVLDPLYLLVCSCQGRCKNKVAKMTLYTTCQFWMLWYNSAVMDFPFISNLSYYLYVLSNSDSKVWWVCNVRSMIWHVLSPHQYVYHILLTPSKIWCWRLYSMIFHTSGWYGLLDNVSLVQKMQTFFHCSLAKRAWIAEIVW